MVDLSEFKGLVHCSSIKLDDVIMDDPKKDRHRYLMIDECGVRFNDKGICVDPKRWHIEEYEMYYCDECLKEGERVEQCYASSNPPVRLCGTHYDEMVKRDHPDWLCPECGHEHTSCCGASHFPCRKGPQYGGTCKCTYYDRTKPSHDWLMGFIK